jgi:hypothetical protein
MGKAKKRRSVDTGPEGRENEPLRRPRPYLSRTQADVERELDVALTKAFMGMVESWELMIAPEAVQGAFVRAVYTLWAEGKRARPALRREELPGADLLLQHRLAVEKDGWVEIPCVTGGLGGLRDVPDSGPGAAGEASANRTYEGGEQTVVTR